ncbi:MAG: MBOAT family O-acyltransferase, partial [Oscillospiraceae bacterium]|nr:MBOAT family O-acyltransferase [Oscillospiraceae bacterium]
IPAKLTLALPAGISFYTFTVVGYAVDVYHKKLEPEKDFVTYALFVSFFPSVLMGPIARAGEMLPQYKAEHKFEYGNLVEGLQRFLTGAFKKVVIADGLGVIVDAVYGSLADYRGPMLLTAVVFYAVQLYADFSGYTDMALGAAKVLGFTLRENFKAPYLATDVSDLWTRWHLSLTTWLTDYIFTPLVWSRWYDKLAHKKDWEQRAPSFGANILIVFLLSGLWHGAGLTFILWGLANGAARCAEDALQRARKRRGVKKKKRAPFCLINNLGRVYVFVFWALSLVLFRSATLADASYVFKNMFGLSGASVYVEQLLHLCSNGISSSKVYLLLYIVCIAGGIVLMTAFDARIYRSSLKGQTLCMNPLGQYKLVPRWLLYWFMGLATAMFFLIGSSGLSTSSQFLYQGF